MKIEQFASVSAAETGQEKTSRDQLEWRCPCNEWSQKRRSNNRKQSLYASAGCASVTNLGETLEKETIVRQAQLLLKARVAQFQIRFPPLCYINRLVAAPTY